MAVVKVQKCCPLCKSDYFAVDEAQLSEKEKYLMYWNYELGSPEAEQAWKEIVIFNIFRVCLECLIRISHIATSYA